MALRIWHGIFYTMSVSRWRQELRETLLPSSFFFHFFPSVSFAPMFLHASSVLCEQCVSAHSVSMVLWKCRGKKKEPICCPVPKWKRCRTSCSSRKWTWMFAFWISFLTQLSVEMFFSVVAALFGKTFWRMSLQLSSSVPKRSKIFFLFLRFGFSAFRSSYNSCLTNTTGLTKRFFFLKLSLDSWQKRLRFSSNLC